LKSSKSVIIFLAFAAVLLPLGCSVLPWNWSGHDPQKLQIFFQLGLNDELDTFHGTYQNDLVHGTGKTEMWLTTREQEIILTKLEEIKFFSLPDTLAAEANATVSPDVGDQIIRIKTGDYDKTVFWHAPLTAQGKSQFHRVAELIQLLNDIIHSQPEYKAMPPSKNVYH
jgi:hypothetical protein